MQRPTAKGTVHDESERSARSTATKGLDVGLEKMRQAGMPDMALKTFAYYYDQLRNGNAGVLPESALEPLEIPSFQDLPCDDAGAREALSRTIVLKLNGGLGTSMGLTGAKSLLEVKDGLTFLGIIARQVLRIRRQSNVRLPLVLMNSFATHDDTIAALARYPDLAADVPPAFVQNRFPKLRADDLRPASWPPDPALEWAPPGHGDLYAAIAVSGMLRQLLLHDYRYAFVSNSDNLGATLEPAFQDITRHRFFNTNNVWLDLEALARLLEHTDGALGLPLIANRKPVDPSDPSSPEVIQLESAMGAAIGAFDRAQALRVPRRRFAPVKTTDDLLAVRSDAYVLTEEGHVGLARQRGDRPPVVELDPRFYRLLPDFDARFPAGPPSLVACDRLRIVGDVRFGRGVIVRGSVTIEHQSRGQLQIEDGVVL